MRTVEPVIKLEPQAVGKGFGPHNGNNVVLERRICALQHDIKPHIGARDFYKT